VIDLMQSFVFVACELLLLGLLFSPVLFIQRDTTARSRILKVVAILFFGIAAGVTTISAGVQIASLTRDNPHASDQVPVNPKLTTEVLHGKPVLIQFDLDACIIFNLGSIECGSDYRGKYDAKANRWTVTGRVNETKTVRSYTSSNSEPTSGSLSVWGMLSSFDDDGNIFHHKERIGTLRLENE
jgi:hypothetical protein